VTENPKQFNFLGTSVANQQENYFFSFKILLLKYNQGHNGPAIVFRRCRC